MRIDVFHDTACPWCRIGKQHLADALAQWSGSPAEVVYHTFFLNDQIPPEGHDFKDYMRAKGGGQIPLEGFFDGPRRAGAAAGIIFNFERIAYAPNTLLSHELIALTPPAKKAAVIDAIYKAYFQDGLDIGSLNVLVEIAAANGLDADATRESLMQHRYRDEVVAEAEEARRLGVTGVPFFVINNALAFSGAQPASAMLRAFEQAEEFTLVPR
jgi:predicted DsbA family dithiol-disulfide isomerase